MENGIDEDDDEEDGDLDEEVFEVDHILSICYGDSKRIKQYGLYLKNEAYSTWTGASTSSATDYRCKRSLHSVTVQQEFKNSNEILE
ncbi:uncharacterized protein [Rutidosis leptorrhynchoides]|uniref:uncharacterized protein isoform X3 n=1 Tax=Rutidosis leptorrhynchoides TaxID=125765 RepID=UPI003A9A177B